MRWAIARDERPARTGLCAPRESLVSILVPAERRVDDRRSRLLRQRELGHAKGAVRASEEPLEPDQLVLAGKPIGSVDDHRFQLVRVVAAAFHGFLIVIVPSPCLWHRRPERCERDICPYRRYVAPVVVSAIGGVERRDMAARIFINHAVAVKGRNLVWGYTPTPGFLSQTGKRPTGGAAPPTIVCPNAGTHPENTRPWRRFT